MPLRIIFMGTAELACASLEALLRSREFELLAVVTQPDRPKGRELRLQPSPVKRVALAARLPVLQPERARDPAFIDQLRAMQPDLIVVVAYGQLLPEAILGLPRFGCINVHTSLLPKYRGAAPIQWAILEGECETGVTIIKLTRALDSGDILSQRATTISPADTAETLHDRLAIIGAQLLIPTILDFTGGRIVPRQQVETDATYARKITKEDGHLDWSLPARMIFNRIRAFTPWPGAFTFYTAQPTRRLLKIWQAAVAQDAGSSPRISEGKAQPGTIIQAEKEGIVVACGEGTLRILSLQQEGGRRLTAAEFLAGHSFKPGDRLE